MAFQTIYRDIGVGNEGTSFGVSVNYSSTLHIISESFALNPNKELLQETVSTAKGRDIMIRVRNTI
jgi:hypothetical protein